MTNDAAEAANRLAELLANENAALAQLELPRAGAMLAAKQRAVQAFAAAHATAPPAMLQRLRGLADDNRRLLEHAIDVQRRVIAIAARAIPPTRNLPRYGATGAIAGANPGALTLSARV